MRVLELLKNVCPPCEMMELITTTQEGSRCWGIYKVDGELYRAFLVTSTTLSLHPEYSTNLFLASLQLKDLLKSKLQR